MLLPLSLEIVGTDRSLGDNGGAVRECESSGRGWVTKKACSTELGDENASCSEY